MEYLNRIAPFVMILVLPVVIALAVLVQRNSSNVDELRSSVRHLEEFVDELETEDPNEVEQNRAITRAVGLVPEIKDILCEEFPTAQACQNGG